MELNTGKHRWLKVLAKSLKNEMKKMNKIINGEEIINTGAEIDNRELSEGLLLAWKKRHRVPLPEVRGPTVSHFMSINLI